LIGEVKGLSEPTFNARDRFQLSFYRNQVIHLFVSEVIISAALYTRIKQGGGPSNQRISYRDLWSQCEFLSQLLKTEFVFELARTLTDNIDKALRGLEKDRVIVWNKEDDMIELSAEERQCGRENYDFYCFLVSPERIWLTRDMAVYRGLLFECCQSVCVDAKSGSTDGGERRSLRRQG
jgi:hypothetical protein